MISAIQTPSVGGGSKLFKSLFELVIKSAETAREQKKQGKIRFSKVHYLADVVSEYAYRYKSKNPRRNLNFTVEQKFVPHSEWSGKSRDRFFEHTIKPSREYHDARTAILPIYESTLKKRYKMDVDLALKELVNRVSIDAMDSEEKLESTAYVADFIGELNDAPVNWECTVWLQGIALAGKEYKFPGGITLRRPIKEDFQGEYNPDNFDVRHPPHDSSLHPTAILSFSKVAQRKDELERKLDRLLVLFRLFDVGSVKYVRCFTQPEGKSVLRKSLLRSDTPDTGDRHLRLSRHYIFDDQHSLVFANFLKGMASFAGRPKANHVRIALERYHHALFSEDSDHGRVATVVSCLEALYCEELKVRAQHSMIYFVAALLGATSDSVVSRPEITRKALEDLGEAYKIRNAHFHGNSPWSKSQEGAKRSMRERVDSKRYVGQLCDRMLGYARFSLVLFCQTSIYSNGKATLLKKADDTMLEFI